MTTTWHNMEMPCLGQPWQSLDMERVGRTSLLPLHLLCIPAHKPTQGPSIQKAVCLESTKGEWLALTRKMVAITDYSQLFLAVQEGNRARPEPDACLGGSLEPGPSVSGGGWKVACGETRPRVERLQGEEQGRESGQGHIRLRGQGWQGFRTDLREPSFFELTRGAVSWAGERHSCRSLQNCCCWNAPGNSEGLEV